MFSEKEAAYIKSQRLARLGTVSNNETQPDVVPVGFDFDGKYFYVGGKNLLKSRKYKNVMKNNKVAFVVDDVGSTESWEPRGIRVYGIADMTSEREGYLGRTIYIRITPKRKWSWGIEAPVFVDSKFVVNKAQTD